MHDGRVILYDAGDFLDDYAVDLHLRNDWSFVFLARIEEARVSRLELVPVRLDFAAVQLAQGVERSAIEERMIRLAAEFDTRVERRTSSLVVDVSDRSIVR